MKIKISSLHKLVIYMALFGQFCILLGLPIGNNKLASMGVTAVMLTSLISLVILLSNYGSDINSRNSAVWLVPLVISVSAACFYGAQVDRLMVVKILTFLQLPIFLLTAVRMRVKDARKAIYTVNMCYPLMFGAFLVSSFSHRYMGRYGETVHENITLGYGNPNEASMYLLVCLIIVFSAMYHYEDKWRRLIYFIEALFLEYLISLAGSRSVLFLSLCVIGFTICMKALRIRKWMLVCVFLFPAVFAILLPFFPMVADTVFMGEALDTGRGEVYRDFLKKLSFASFWTGSFEEYSLANMHNGYVSIFASLGIFPTLFFIRILYRSYKRVCCIKIEKKENIALLLGVLSIMIHSAAEAAFLVSGSVYAISVFLLFYLFVSSDEINFGDTA